MNTLKAEKRTLAVKAKKLRREGYVTGNVFGKEMKESIPVKMDAAAVDRLLKTSNKGSQIMLDIDGESHNVLIKEVDYNPLKGRVDEMDFQALVKDEVVHSVAEIVLVNHDKLESGVLQQQLEEVSYKALPSALVAQDKDVHLVTDPETTVVTVTESHIAIADDEDSEETE